MAETGMSTRISKVSSKHNPRRNRRTSYTQIIYNAIQQEPTPKASPERNIVSWTLSGKFDREKKVLIDAANPKRFVSLDKAIELVASLSDAFTSNSTVCLHIPNDVLYPVLCLAIFASGCRWTGTNISYKAPELEHHFKTSLTKYVIAHPDRLEAVEEAVEKSGAGAEIILFCDTLSSFGKCCQTVGVTRKYKCLHDLLRKRSERLLWKKVENINPEQIASLMSTSGTTGRPKMAARTHHAHVYEAKAIADEASQKPYEVRRLYCTPIFHAFSTPEMMFNALHSGTPSYFMERFHPTEVPNKIQEFGITEIFAPPAMLLKLANTPECAEQLQSLRMVFTGGAPYTPELRAKFNKLFPTSSPPAITPVYGMTEIGWVTTLKWSERESTVAVGRMLPGYELKYGKAFDTLSGGQKVYELLVRSPSMMSCYFGNAEATKEALSDGWLKTGDVGYCDHGRIFLVDRAKDLIKYNGWQVSPTELGDALLTSPDVKDAAVVGVGEAEEEHPVAFVVRSDCSPNVTAQEVKAHLLTRLAKYKAEPCEIRFLEEVPKNPTGKIDRNELKRLAEAS